MARSRLDGGAWVPGGKEDLEEGRGRSRRIGEGGRNWIGSQRRPMSRYSKLYHGRSEITVAPSVGLDAVGVVVVG
jgi:hypothetical protein